MQHRLRAARRRALQDGAPNQAHRRPQRYLVPEGLDARQREADRKSEELPSSRSDAAPFDVKTAAFA
jgi:hypothetical protein